MPSWLRLFSTSAAGMLLVLRAPAIHAVDCNQNRVDDAVDVATGTSPDCNRNLVPDECDVLPVSYGLAFERGIFSSSAASVVAKDLDADGSPDVLVAPVFGRSISVLWDVGAGGIIQRTEVETDDTPGPISAADLEGDGDVDFAFTEGESVFFRLNGGDRSFSRGTAVLLGFRARAITLADLDLDGDADLVAAGPFEVAVSLRSSSGTFEEPRTNPVGSGPVAMVVADLDGDGDPEIATGNSLGNISILLNEGAGLFELPRNFASGGAAERLEAADMDGDGDADLVMAFPLSRDGQGVAVLENAGNASFEAAAPIEIPLETVAIIPADVDRDGDIDLLLPATWIVFLQNHGGVLGPAELFPVNLDPQAAAAADLNGDGRLEIVESQAQAGALLILHQVPWQNRQDCNRDGVPDDCQLAGNDCNENRVPDRCDIASGSSRDCDANGTPDECEPDCNGNESPDECDIAARTSADCNGNSIPDECDLLPQVDIEPAKLLDRDSTHVSLHAADLDGDRDLDLVTAVGPLAIRSFLNSGNGTFELASDQPLGRVAFILLVADLEGDGDPDLVLGDSTSISVMTNDGKGRFESGPAVDSSFFVIVGGDLDGDGDLDLVTGSQSDVKVRLFTGKDFGPASDLIRGERVGSLVAADFDSDGDLDVASVLPGTGVIRTFLNDGSAGFPSVRDSPGGNLNSTLTAVDLDGDGDLDLADQIQTTRLEIHINQGDGRFADPLPILFEPFAGAVAASDLDGDGDADLAVGTAIRDFNCAPGSGLSFLLNDGSPRFATFEGPLVEPLSVPHAVVAGDLDGDGLGDVAMLAFPQCHCCIGPTQTSIHVILNRTIPAPSRDRNHNGLPDECEEPSFRRGDSSADGRFDITDAVLVLLHLFQGGPAPVCASSADSNDDAKIDVTDPIHFLGWLFAGGPPPPHPGAACGHDPDPPGAEGNLGCAAYEGC